MKQRHVVLQHTKNTLKIEFLSKNDDCSENNTSQVFWLVITVFACHLVHTISPET